MMLKIAVIIYIFLFAFTLISRILVSRRKNVISFYHSGIESFSVFLLLMPCLFLFFLLLCYIFDSDILINLIPLLKDHYAILGLFLIYLAHYFMILAQFEMKDRWGLGTRGQHKGIVRTGIYSKVRHPIYTFGFLQAVGIFFIVPTLATLYALLILFVGIFIQTMIEESYLLTFYNKEYSPYHEKTGRFFPRLI